MWEWSQPIREGVTYVTSSLIGWDHSHMTWNRNLGAIDSSHTRKPNKSENVSCCMEGFLVISVLSVLTHWGPNKILLTTSSNAFSWKKMFVFWFKFHWSLFPCIHSTIIQHWFSLWLGAKQVTNHYLNQWWPRPMMPYWIPRPQWVNMNK